VDVDVDVDAYVVECVSGASVSARGGRGWPAFCWVAVGMLASGGGRWVASGEGRAAGRGGAAWVVAGMASSAVARGVMGGGGGGSSSPVMDEQGAAVDVDSPDVDAAESEARGGSGGGVTSGRCATRMRSRRVRSAVRHAAKRISCGEGGRVGGGNRTSKPGGGGITAARFAVLMC
jgi:hypothetical protein